LPGCLPQRGRIHGHVEDVIRDLERHAEPRAELAERAIAAVGAAEDRADAERGAEQRAGLHGVDAAQLRRVRRCRPSASRSSTWPPTMPAAPAALQSSVTRVRGRRPAAHLALRHRQQAAGEHGMSAKPASMAAVRAEHAVRRRPAAAQVVVVHARQVVMHERVGVDQFDGARCAHPAVRRAVARRIGAAGRHGGIGGGEAEDGPQSLAAAGEA
jgi:hypothetical protein